MIKRDPQEVADFLGVYVAQDEDGDWYIFCEKPELNNSCNVWSGGWYMLLNPDIIAIPKAHNWRLLYEPQGKQEKSEGNSLNSGKKDGSCYQDFADSDNNAPHQSEVYVGERYVLLGEFNPDTLMQKVQEYLNKGYMLYGNPWTGPDTGSYGYIHYQAMVRGLC